MKKITLIVEDENGKQVTAYFDSEKIKVMKDTYGTNVLEQMYNVLIEELKQIK
jgi:hypothetical protein